MASDSPSEESPRATGARATLRWAVWNDPERRPRLPWRLLAGLVVFAIVGALAGIGTALLPPATALGGKFLRPLYALVLYLGGTGLLVAALVGSSYLVDRRVLTEMGLQLDRQWWRDCAFGLALGVALPTLVFLVELAAGWLTVTGVGTTGQSSILPLGSAPAPFAFLLVVLFFVGVSVFEEVLVRGYLLTNLAEGLAGIWRIGVRGAILLATLLTAALFGVLHASNPNATLLSTANIALVGIMLGLGYALTDRLGVPVGMHLTWNTTVGAVYGFPVSGISVGVTLVETETTGPDLVTGGRFGPEGGLVALLTLVVGLGLLWWWVRRAYGDVELREAVAIPELRE